MPGLPPILRNDFPNWHQGQVRHTDIDSNGHVNNAVYSVWLDDARYELIHPLLVPTLEIGDFLALVTMRVDYRKEVRFGDRPRVGSLLTRLGDSAIEFEQGIWVERELVARAQSITVIANRITAKSCPLSDRQRRLMQGLMAPSGQLVS